MCVCVCALSLSLSLFFSRRFHKGRSHRRTVKTTLFFPTWTSYEAIALLGCRNTNQAKRPSRGRKLKTRNALQLPRTGEKDAGTLPVIAAPATAAARLTWVHQNPTATVKKKFGAGFVFIAVRCKFIRDSVLPFFSGKCYPKEAWGSELGRPREVTRRECCLMGPLSLRTTFKVLTKLLYQSLPLD